MLRRQRFIVYSVFILCNCLIILFSCGRNRDDSKTFYYDPVLCDTVYLLVEEMPVYKNGEIDYITDFNKGLQYNYSPNDSLQTSVLVKFIIDKKGRLVNPEIEGKMNDELTPLENACIKSLSMLQNWSCGKKDGVPVNVFCKKVIRVDFQ
ncbi:MAG: hypothetical protein IKQ01_08625 [Bacteroidales bacterium]|nr:hypothetical protein [Bacteroidales bacterium]